MTDEGKQKVIGLQDKIIWPHWLALICDPRGKLQVSSDLVVCCQNSSASDWKGLIYQCLQQWQLGGQWLERVLTGQVKRKKKWGWKQRGQEGQCSSL